MNCEKEKGTGVRSEHYSYKEGKTREICMNVIPLLIVVILPMRPIVPCPNCGPLQKTIKGSHLLHQLRHFSYLSMVAAKSFCASREDPVCR